MNTSTRSEILGAIIALCTHGAIHLGIDDKACLLALLQLVSLAARLPPQADPDARSTPAAQRKHSTGQLRKMWALHEHGDLLKVMFRCIVAKTPAAIAASKVKGHAQQRHIELGISTPEQKQGNDNADAAADTGMQLFEPAHTVSLATFFHRHNQYVENVAGVQNIVVDMMLAN